MNIEKVNEVFSDQQFVTSLFAMETVAEVQAALKEHGIDLTEQEILSIQNMLSKVESGEISADQMELLAKKTMDGELSDESLEQVAGGFVITATVALVTKVVCMTVMAAVGVGAGFGIGQYMNDRRW